MPPGISRADDPASLTAAQIHNAVRSAEPNSPNLHAAAAR